MKLTVTEYFMVRHIHPYKHLAMTLFFALFSTFLIAGGGWPQPKGKGYFKLSEWWIVADEHYTDAGIIDPNVTFGLFNTVLYAEYGFTNKLTGILNFPFFSRAYFDNTVSAGTGEIIDAGESINTIGDTDISLKYGLYQRGSSAFSVTFKVGLPLGEEAGGSNESLQTGDGEFNQSIRLDYGTSTQLGKIPVYANVYSAFNNRTKGFSDEVRYGVEFGGTFAHNRLTALMRLYGITSLKNGNDTGAANSTSIFANNSEHFSFSPEISYRVGNQWGFSASYAGAFSGNIIFADPSYSFGMYV